MADKKISALADGGSFAAGDLIPIVRGGDNYRLAVPSSLIPWTFDVDLGGTADAAIAAAVNTFYVRNIAGFTADRTLTLPATAAVGDRVGLCVPTGDSAFELLLTANTGDTLNGIAGGTEWSRLFIDNEFVIMRCVVANATWVVEYDGRIAQKCDLLLTTSADGEAADTFVRPTQCSTAGVWTAAPDAGAIAAATSDRINIRRGNPFLVYATARSKDTAADGKYYNFALFKNVAETLVLLGHTQMGALGNPLAANTKLITFATDDYVVFKFRSQDGGVGALLNQTWFGLVEQL
jgi:hypothetical protein